MLKIVKCQYCGKEFVKKEEDYDDYVRECALHEIEHLHIKEQFENNLQDAIKVLNHKYDSTSDYKNYNLDVEQLGYEVDDINYIIYNFELTIDKNIQKDIQIYGKYKDFKNCLATQEIIDEIEKYYKSNIKKMYEGKVTFEDWLGGNGANDYVLDGQYMRDIFAELLGKKIKITVVDD